jgi:hypothetical protein
MKVMASRGRGGGKFRSALTRVNRRRVQRGGDCRRGNYRKGATRGFYGTGPKYLKSAFGMGEGSA